MPTKIAATYFLKIAIIFFYLLLPSKLAIIQTNEKEGA